MDFEINEITPEDSSLIASVIATSWGSPISVSKGRVLDTTKLPGFICKQGEKVSGLVTYFIDEEGCEIVTLNCFVENRGLGTHLVNKVIEKARTNGCKRVWLITTNDNAHAIRFYQKKGFDWIDFYKDSMDISRKLKPEIAELGYDEIPMRHELEFEMKF